MSPLQVAAAVVALPLATGALWRRRDLGTEKTVLALLAAGLLGVYASGVLGLLPNFEQLIEGIAETLGAWTYALVGVLSFLETGAFVGLLIPGETTVIAGGVIAGQGEIDIVPLIGLVWLCTILGDSTSFAIGKRLGRGFLMKHGPRLKITHERLEQVERYFAQHGGKTILIGRFIGLVRALAPFIAGSSGMRYGRFLPYSVIGTGLWSAAFCLLGYLFYRSFSQVADIAGTAVTAFGTVVATVVVVVLVYRRLRHAEERARLKAWIVRQAERPLLRPLARLARPVWRRVLRPLGRAAAPRIRFVWDRLTPGNLGIEFTTAVAVAVAGLYVFALYVVVLSGSDALTTGDRLGADVAADLRNGKVVDVVKVLTDLGSFAVTAVLIGLAALLLAWRRRPAELLALVAGFALVVVAVQLAKAGIDRQRPGGGLTAAEGQSFPSGHAAYATAYAALAVVASRVLPNLAIRAALVLAMMGVTVFVGLSRMYLGVHYWSDVAGGWGLGLGTFAGCGAVALLVTHIRHNGGSPRRLERPWMT